jgi:uncharacterized protein with HEPN domain
LPSDKPIRRLEDIVENAHAIERYVARMDIVQFDLPPLCAACEDALRRLRAG